MNILKRISAGAMPLAAIVAFTAVPAAKHLRPEPYPVLQPGEHELWTGPANDHAVRYQIILHPIAADSAERELGVQATFEERVAGAGHTRSTGWVSYAKGTVVASDTLLYDVATLQPASERLHSGPRTSEFTYTGKTVTWVLQQPDSAPRTSTQSFPVSLFAFNELDQIVRFIPHREGVGYILPLYSEGDRNIEYDTVTVAGRRANGSWIVRFADPVIISTYDVDDASRMIVGRDVTRRKTGDRIRYVAEAAAR